MTVFRRIARDCRGAAAAEMAMVTPLLLLIMMGSVELGNYFMNEHILVKAVRDGARYAARQNFVHYSACTGSPAGTVVADTKNVVMTGMLSGGTNKLRNWSDSTITVTMTCTTTAGTQTMAGIYTGFTSGAPRVTVSATVPYQPILESFGFKGTGFNLNASQHAAVMGV